MSVTKATIVTVPSALTVVCHFNPKDLKIDKKNSWTAKDNQGKNMGILEFGGGSPGTINVQLLFDAAEKGGDVRNATKILLKMMMIDPRTVNPQTQLGEPYRVRFQWGSFLGFEAVITSVGLNYTMFRDDGTPIRATATVAFQQSKDDENFANQNPTSRSDARKMHVVIEGETLNLIAYQEFGDPSYWRHIAETNNIANPLAIYPGQVLKIVPPSI